LSGPADVLLDARVTRRMSVGMAAYARELAARLPRIAPDLRFDVYRDGSNFGPDEQVMLPLYALRSKARFVHHLSVYAPLLTPAPFAITIHDLIHLRFPDQFKRSVGPYYRTVVRAVCARARIVFTDDPRTVADLERFLQVDPRKIRVVPLGVDDAFTGPLAAPAAARPYFFYAGNHRAHKNLRVLIEAWLALPEDREADLVLTGEDDLGSLGGARRRLGTLRFAGDVTTADLALLYRGAAAYVHPALCEGFGLPMLEAAAVGTPVIASEECVPAVLRAIAARFPAADAGALGGLLLAALDGPPAEAERERLRTVARFYSWDRVAASTAEVYREVLEECPSR
jgi:glycosyltransferase involved in cell wall biosynthesis